MALAIGEGDRKEIGTTANAMEHIMETNISILSEIALEFFPVCSMPILRGVQVDGVCPRCGRWHTLALCNGEPFCIWNECHSYRHVAAKGGGQ